MDKVVEIFRLDEILETIDMEKNTSIHLKQLGASFPETILDYLKLEELRQQIGEIGENYVYELERERLRKAGSKYADKVSRAPAKNPENGYDILSYTEDGREIHIEVKSTTENLNEPFYMTKNERQTASRVRANGGIYQIHRVYNIGREIAVFVYKDESMFRIEEILYRIEPI